MPFQHLAFGTLALGSAQERPRPPITRENARQMVELMRLGRGSAEKVAFSPDGQIIAVGDSGGRVIFLRWSGNAASS